MFLCHRFNQDSWQIHLVMVILGIITEQHIFILDRAYSSTCVGPDLGTADVQGEDEEGKGNLGLEMPGTEVGIQGSDEGEDNHKELKKRYRHDNKVDSCSMHFLVDLTPGTDKCKIVTIHEMLVDEVETAKGSDKRT